jgi:hypothetical protein
MTKTQNDRIRRHQLMTSEIRRGIPPLGSQTMAADPIAHAKYFDITTDERWFVLEFDGVDTLRCLYVGSWVTYMDVSLHELDARATVGRVGCPTVERDLYWDIAPVSEIVTTYGAGLPIVHQHRPNTQDVLSLSR